jgi:hypothetical protein
LARRLIRHAVAHRFPIQKVIGDNHVPPVRRIILRPDHRESSLKTFDVVIENYFFVALDPALRQETIQRIHSLVKNNGFYAGVFFTRSSQEGPPFGLSEWELRAHVESLFEIKEWIRSPFSHPKRQDMELWVVLQKK